jgi:hypothetical protein
MTFPEAARIHVTAEWLDHAGVRNGIFSLDNYAGLVVASHPGFVRIHAPAPPGPLGESLRHAIAGIVPAYLQDLSERRLWIEKKTDHHVYDILADVADWFERWAGDARAVRKAREYLYVDSLNLWDAFLELIQRMLEEGDLAIHAEHRYRRCPEIVYQNALPLGRPAVGIPAFEMNEILASRRAPAFDLAGLEAHLRQQNVWLGIDLFKGQEVWLLDREFVDAKVIESRTNRRQPTCEFDEIEPTQAGEVAATTTTTAPTS